MLSLAFALALGTVPPTPGRRGRTLATFPVCRGSPTSSLGIAAADSPTEGDSAVSSLGLARLAAHPGRVRVPRLPVTQASLVELSREDPHFWADGRPWDV